MTDSLPVWLLIALAAAVTYGWRGAGVLLGRNIDVDSRLFRWASAVAYALLAGLVARMIVFPEGPLAATELASRLAAAAAGACVFFLTRRNLLLGLGAAMAVLVLLSLGIR